MTKDSGHQPNDKRHYDIIQHDLPLSCPMAGMRVWDSHPRVYLPIEPGKTVECPYCSATYTLKKTPL